MKLSNSITIAALTDERRIKKQTTNETKIERNHKLEKDKKQTTKRSTFFQQRAEHKLDKNMN